MGSPRRRTSCLSSREFIRRVLPPTVSDNSIDSRSVTPSDTFRRDLILLACLSLLLRWVFRGRWLEGWDSVNFAYGVLHFDPLHHQPHFPGYPVYMAAAKLFHALGADPVAALALTGAVGGGLAVIPLMVLTREAFGSRVAAGAGLLYAVNPLLWLESEKAFSDPFGLLLLLSALAAAGLAYRRSRGFYAAGVLMGLALGVRLSYFPFLVPLAASCFQYSPSVDQGSRRNLLRMLNGGILGVGAWSLPLLFRFPSAALLQAGESHAEGHFTQWGGSIVTDPGALDRLTAFLWNLGPNGFGLWWPDAPQPVVRLLLTLLTLPLLVRGFRQLARAGWTAPFFWAFVPYALWALLGQNLTSVRHVMPLVALLIPVLAAGMATPFSPRSFLPLTFARAVPLLLLPVAVLLTASVSFPLLHLHATEPPTRVQAARYLRESHDHRSAWLLTWNSTRVLEWYAPEWASRVLADPPKALPNGERLLVLSDSPKLDALKRAGYTLRLLRQFERSRYVHTWFHRLDLWEARK
ncbi:MAG: glycosyltransferase family 39 protein [Armatimonadetes bacterium]|nr:glycosyltransferase family 39 protein [Armatimonadota bacterium]